MKSQKLTLDLAADDDLSNIIDFLLKHPSPTLPPPSDDELLEAVKNGHLFFVFREQRRKEIVATGGSFVWIRGNDKIGGSAARDVVVYELAAMRVIGEVGGLAPFAIQDLFIWLRTVSLALWEQPQLGELSIMTAVLGDAKRSLDAMQRAGFEKIDDRPKWLQYQHHIWTRGEEAAHYFWLPTAALRAHARSLSAILGRPIILHRHNKSNQQELFELEIVVPLLPGAHSAINDIGLGGGAAILSRPPPKFKRLGTSLI